MKSVIVSKWPAPGCESVMALKTKVSLPLPMNVSPELAASESQRRAAVDWRSAGIRRRIGDQCAATAVAR